MRKRLRPPLSHTPLKWSGRSTLVHHATPLVSRSLCVHLRIRLVCLLLLFVGAATLMMTPSMPTAAQEIPFFTSQSISTSANDARDIHVADVNHDGSLDVVAATSSNVQLFSNDNGDASTWSSTSIVASGANAVHAADVNWDGTLDVVAASDTEIAWYDQAASWSAEQIVATGAQDIYPAEVDGDGTVDIIAAHASTITWYKNDGGWTAEDLDAANGANALYVADMNHDGDLDILAAATDNNIVWYQNDGTPPFTREVIGAVNGATSVSAADIDGDGSLDVLAASEGDDTVAWYRNDGAGAFGAQQVIASNADQSQSVSATDVDSDGDVDVVSTSAGSDTVTWYENSAGDGSTWTPRTITTDAGDARAAYAVDIDSDGDMDVIGAAPQDDEIAWYRNDTIHRSAVFPEESPIGTVNGAQWVYPVDLDQDGDLDALSTGYNGNNVIWHENTAGDGSAWSDTEIANGVTQAVMATTFDKDQDGDLDILVAGLGGTVAWYENGNAWAATTIVTLAGARTVNSADMDNDGKLDVLVSTNQNSAIAWYHDDDGDNSWDEGDTIDDSLNKPAFAYPVDIDDDGDTDVIAAHFIRHSGSFVVYRNDGGGTTWTAVNISTGVDGAASVYPADIDHDGDMDVLSTAYYDNSVAWHENTNGDGSTWARHEISAGAEGASSAYAVDMDNDGDLDVLSSSQIDNKVAWYANTQGDGSEWAGTNISVNTLNARAVRAGDIDGDGDMDALSTSLNNDTVAWYENGGGQFALATTDNAPATLASGQFADVLRIDAFHRGRTNDHDVELVTFELLIEEAENDPLTTAEAQSIVANLYIYRDSDGSETFEVSSDTQIAVINNASLALSSGVQTIAFEDGDSDVQIPFDTSATYFVVVQLTVDAIDQEIDQFRITHLTESSSTGEDRDEDIPLTLEFVEDTASSIIIIDNATTTLETNAGTTVDEGGSVTIGNTTLQASDTDDTASGIIYTLLSTPANGTLFNDGTALAVGDSFTQDDIDNNLIGYTHDGSETTSDNFTFWVGNEGDNTTTNSASFTITVTPLNDAPVVATNTGTTVDEGDGLLIESSMLQVTDSDNTAEQIIFTFVETPDAGALYNGTTPMGSGVTFTQDDIDNDRIRYVHSGHEDDISDLFTFTVSDGAGGTIDETTFEISVTILDDEPLLTTNTGVTVDEGQAAIINSSMLLVADSDSSTDEITYTLITTPLSGTLSNSEQRLAAGDTFTQADIDSNRIQYTHNGSETTDDRFTFTVSDEAGNTIDETAFEITIVPQNDAPTLSLNEGATVDEGGSTVISGTLLQAIDDTMPTAELVYILEAVPAVGTLFNGEAPLAAGDTFTQADIDSGQIRYVHDGSDALTDTFSFVVSDGVDGTTTTMTFTITIVQQNDSPLLSNLATEPATPGEISPLLLSGTIIDSDPGDTFRLFVDWGDGSTPQTFTYGAGTTEFAETYQYGDDGAYTIVVTLVDASGEQVTSVLAVTVTNAAPIVANPIPEQQATWSQLFAFTFAADVFTDAPGDTLSYSAARADGSSLPSWLSFDPATRTFRGTPGFGDLGRTDITITATDDDGASTTHTFNLVVVSPQLSAVNIAFLPIVMGGSESPLAQTRPDLVGQISIIPDKHTFEAGEPVTLQVVVTNQGTATADPFWVDLYINPSRTPTVNNRWDDICGLFPCHGIAWSVTEPLEPGESMTLTSTDGYAELQTIWPGWFARGTTDLYVLVDSWNPGTPTGSAYEGILENNNLTQLGGLRIIGNNPPDNLIQVDDLPERPATP